MPYTVGETVKGVVCGITDYGAFLLLDEGVSGMIHISKISDSFVSDIHDILKKGDELSATVISVKDGKIALSLIEGIKKQEKPRDFESMLSAYKTVSEENIARLNSRNKKKKR